MATSYVEPTGTSRIRMAQTGAILTQPVRKSRIGMNRRQRAAELIQDAFPNIRKRNRSRNRMAVLNFTSAARLRSKASRVSLRSPE